MMMEGQDWALVTRAMAIQAEIEAMKMQNNLWERFGGKRFEPEEFMRLSQELHEISLALRDRAQR